MSSEHEDEIARSVRDPYFFRPLYTGLRKLISVIGSWPDDYIEGVKLFSFTRHHDHIRQLVGWNFLIMPVQEDVHAHEPAATVNDWTISYRITKQAREFAQLELSNISHLRRATLILLRADYAPERRIGLYTLSTSILGFYSLVMLLDRSESAIQAVLRDLDSMGLVRARLVLTDDGRVYHALSDIGITEQGISYLEGGTQSMTFNNINIIESNVGVVALGSTLTNIDAKVGNIRQKGHGQVADALSRLTEGVASSDLPATQKKDILEQVEAITEQAEKEPHERKPAVIKAVISSLERTLSAAGNVAQIWRTWGPAITGYFGI